MMERKNIGLCILRAWMCFEVVLSHFWIPSTPVEGIQYLFYIVREYHVPVFMFMSFYLTADTIVVGVKVKKRLKRLILPHIFWSCFYFCLYRLVETVCRANLNVQLGDLLWQIISGHSERLNDVLWYQTNLIWITVLFLLITRIWKSDSKWMVFSLVMLGAVGLQYSGANWQFFSNMRFELEYPLGRLAEMIPLAACGLIMGRFRVFEKIRDKVPRRHLIIGLTLLLVFFTSYPVFIIPDGFGYSGIKRLVVAVCLVYLFWMLPFDWCSNKMKAAISQITNYTLGIYCLHFGVRNILRWFVWSWYGMKEGTFGECIIVYITCCVIAVVIAHSHISGIRAVVE